MRYAMAVTYCYCRNIILRRDAWADKVSEYRTAEGRSGQVVGKYI